MRMLTLLLLLSAAACTGLHPSAPSDESVALVLQDLEPTLDAIVNKEMAATHLPGVAVVIVHDGKTIIKRGYGVADVASGRTVDTEQTLFRIGSVSKALTTLAVTRLVDDKRVGLKDDVTRYFDQIINQSGTSEPVTIEHLLTHTAGFDQIGLNRHVFEYNQTLDERKSLRPSLSDFLGEANLRRVTPPGQLFRYDTYGITLAGLVLARATALSYADAMRQELFEPLGMTSSFVEADDAHLPDLAVGYGWRDSAYIAQPYEVYMTTPASSIDATPADMARLIEAITGGGANANGRLYSEATATAVLSPQYRPHPKFTGITHGFWESPSFDPPDGPAVHSIGHGGSMLGYWTLLEILTEKNVGVFIVANRHPEAGGGPVNLGSRISRAVIDALYDIPPAIQVADAVSKGDRDLSPYTGDYAFGTFCKSCTQQEFARGAWSIRNPRLVALAEEGLKIDEQIFLPTADADVFVREDRKQEVFFGRDEAGNVSFFVSSFGPSTFERIPALGQVREGLAEGERLVAAGQVNEAGKVIAAALRLGVDHGLQNEGMINALGYQYLENENTAMALQVFRFNANSYPDSWNVYDSLGEALALAGRYAEAIVAYERSVALNPDSESGNAALERLRSR